MYVCVCICARVLYALLKVHCAITKLETCKMLFFICTIHITRLYVNRDYVFSTHRTIACRDMYCVPLNVVCMYSMSVKCVFSSSADHVTRYVNLVFVLY